VSLYVSHAVGSCAFSQTQRGRISATSLYRMGIAAIDAIDVPTLFAGLLSDAASSRYKQYAGKYTQNDRNRPRVALPQPTNIPRNLGTGVRRAPPYPTILNPIPVTCHEQQDDMADVLTMARSFGSFFYFLCQNVSTAIPDARILEQLHTNIRWSLTLRGTPRDALFPRPSLPVTARLERPEPHPFREHTIYSAEEERALLLDGIAHLPGRAPRAAPGRRVP